jgi:hypothetical protein
MDSPKYNRTFHFPFSPGATNDDKIATSMDKLIGVPIVLTEKMDGSNTSLEYDGCYARTHAGPPTHASFDQLKALHAAIKHNIPQSFQLFGEWCFAHHSIAYSELPAYFMMFGVRELANAFGAEEDYWPSWEDVELWAIEIGVPTVPVLFKGTVSSEKELKDLVESFMNQPSACGGIREGVVVRVANSFVDEDFSSCVMKCVRANHVQTSEHWKDQEIIKNRLKTVISGT